MCFEEPYSTPLRRYFEVKPCIPTFETNEANYKEFVNKMDSVQLYNLNKC